VPGLPSETFIRRHVETLAPGRTVVIARRPAPDGPGRWTTDAPVLWLDELADAWGGEREREAVAAFLSRHGVRAVLAEYLDIWLPFLDVFRVAGVRTVAHAHGYDISQRLRDAWWREEYRALAGADAVVTMSQASRARLLDLGLPAERVHVVPYGVDLPPPRERLPPAEEVHALAVGRLVAKKAPLVTIEAVRRAAAAAPGLRLTLVGDGPLMEEARAAADGLAVDLPGAAGHADVLALMAGADVFCQHSVVDPETGDEEGLPVAVLEAMAHGLPVASTCHGGIPEAVAEGVSGFLVDEGDVEGMAQRLAQLAGDPALRAQMGAAGRRIAEARFTADGERDALLALLDLPSGKARPRVGDL
jgi:colanic acid/amylovoran biosynthesis glycosyltransferase